MSQKLIFIVDDDRNIRKGYSLILGRIEGCKVHAYECPRDLLNALEEGQEPDIIVTDNDMPGMTGGELVRHLRSRGFVKPIIMSSGSDKVKADAELMSLLQGFIPKPSPIDEIRTLVETALAS